MAYSNTNIGDSLLNKQTTTRDVITKWNTVTEILKKYHISNTVNVPVGLTNKYKGDLYGLFKELNIDDEYIYPHIKVNGYNNSGDYKGDKNVFLIIDRDILVQYDISFRK